jgi:hypothetical protein
MTDVDSAAGLSSTQLTALRAECRRVLEGNWREGTDGRTRFAYTAPSAGHYPWQWYWDSCFTAIAWRRFDGDRSRRELESLLSASSPEGFIGHTIFWGRPLTGVRRLFYNVQSPHDRMTRTIQPPLLAWAWKAAVGDPCEVPAIVRHIDSVERERDLDGDGLIWIIQPDESGLDASPAFDRAWGWRSDGMPGFPLLVRRNRRLGFDIRRVLADGGPVVCGVTTNVLYGLSRLALRRPSITPVIVDRLYDAESGLFRQIVRPETGGRRALTWASLSALALPDLPEEIGRRLVEEYLLDRERFWLPVPPPSVAANDPAFGLRDTFLRLRRYWRGPTWINSAWLVWLGLVRLGYHDEGREMARRLADAVGRAGLREYYNPYTGEGMGAPHFSWSALVLELAEPDRAAVGSFV